MVAIIDYDAGNIKSVEISLLIFISIYYMIFVTILHYNSSIRKGEYINEINI